MSNLSAYEQETIINFNAEEKKAEIYTAEKRIMDKLDALVEQYPEHYKFIRDLGDAKEYEVVSKKLISFKKPVILTEEQKEKLRQQLKKIRKEN